jgi:predicted nucleotidyltransferase
MHSLIAAQRSAIADVCRRYQVRRLDVFGSAARGTDFDPERSDADFLVEFAPMLRPIWAAGSASTPS